MLLGNTACSCAMQLDVYFRCETRNHLWLVLEYCVGGNLMSLLKEEPGLSENCVHDFAHDIAKALQHVHASGLVTVRCPEQCHLQCVPPDAKACRHAKK